MGLFDIFKKKNTASDNRHIPHVLNEELEGPTFLEGYTVAGNWHTKPDTFEWRRKLQLPSGSDKFKIKYYGTQQDDEPILFGTAVAPILVLAVSEDTGHEILLFDGCRHGYNAMFCDSYSREQLDKRTACHIYKDKWGNETFEILLSAYYQMSHYEFLQMIDENGNVELLDGTTIRYEIAWRNCYDVFSVFAINEAGDITEVVSEELA